tara:strand:+ start:221 stop:379 length:159 start_codon:yes stop_codon:yes gene_type:complete
MRWDKKQGERLGVKYPGRATLLQTVEARTPQEAINRAQALNPGFVKVNMTTR